MKTIGIKLADGTFYPILEEGTPKKRMLDLTTAKDNQTKVQIDLYRSETGSMDDAEYVDTLEVTKLNPHPNGEPELHLSVGLDEDNKLSAEVVDPETGKKSETEVTLVTRTEDERNEPADFNIATDFPEQIVDSDSHDNAVEETTFSPDELPEIQSNALEDMPAFSFGDETVEAKSDGDEIDSSLPDYSELDDIPIEDTTLESVSFTKNDLSDANEDDVIGTESPDLTDDADVQTDTTTIADTNSADDFSADAFSLPEFDDDSTVAADSSDSLDSDDTLPEFNDDTDPFATTDTGDTSDTLPDFSDDTTFATDTSDSDDLGNFEVPDFDSLASSADESSTDTNGLDFSDLDDPAFSSTEFDSTLDDLNSEPEDKFFDDLNTSTASTGSAMDFSDLYDKETLAGEHASLYDEEDEEKKTRKPVIICIICAIICVIAVILLLFIVPSKYNLIASRNTNGVSILDRFFSKEKETVIEKQVETPEQLEATEEPEISEEDTKFVDVQVEEPKTNEPAPEAVEDKIVIASEPEKVVPAPVQVEEKKPETKKSEDVKYHIRWGDTLWDISESYYKTPWKYPKIADYNKIKNPDVIIAGSDILIPSE